MVVVNGQREDRIPVHDRGLNYGDGLFETIALIRGVPQHWDLHLQRMARGCERLGFPFPAPEVFAEDIERLPPPPARCVLKLVLTRGVGGRGYLPPDAPSPTRIARLVPWPDYPAAYATDGVTVRLCRTRLGINPLLAGIKHLNRLEQVLARAEWREQDVPEGLMLDARDRLVEGTMSNVVLIFNGSLHTPSVRDCGVAGIMREVVMRECRAAGISITERDIGWQEVRQAQEMFLTNSLIGVWPVRRVTAPEGQWLYGVPELTRQLRSRMSAQLPDAHA